MRTTILSFVAAVLMLGASAQTSADSTGFDGDQLSLPGVLEVFKTSKDLDGFLKNLNSESSEVNNLDLNQDGKADFIDMRLEADGDNKAIVLSVDVNEKESHDVAIIAMEKTGPETVVLEIIGDAYVYGSQMVYSPKDEVMTKAKGGPAVADLVTVDWCNVYFWDCVNGIYADQFLAPLWTWQYGVYPSWWSRWQCRARHLYYARCGYWGAFYNRRMVIHCSNGWAAGAQNVLVSPLVTDRSINYAIRRDKKGMTSSNANTNGGSQNNGDHSDGNDNAQEIKKSKVEQRPTSGKDIDKAKKPVRREPVRTEPKPNGPKTRPNPPAPKPSGPRPSSKQPAKGVVKPATGVKKK